jgi:hypothetical protein
MFPKNILNFLKLIIINFFILFFIIFISELFLGSWFKNNFSYKLSSERNINRVYKFDFEYHKGISHYIKNDYGFRVNQKNFIPSEIGIVFVGGSTINQKFINYDDTIVGIIKKKTRNPKIANSGVDGMSVKGHINSFRFWFDKIKDFKPKYYIYLIGINDRYLVDTLSFRDHIDNLEESTQRGNIREYLESNSFFYKKGRYIKSILFLKYNLNIGVKNVKKNHVYLDRKKIEFISYFERENEFNILSKLKKKKYIKFEKWYLKKLDELTKLVKKRKGIPIFITQTTGYGHSFESYIVARSIIKNCETNKLICIDPAQNLELKYEDFYDESHLNINGSKKFADYIYKELSIF